MAKHNRAPRYPEGGFAEGADQDSSRAEEEANAMVEDQTETSEQVSTEPQGGENGEGGEQVTDPSSASPEGEASNQGSQEAKRPTVKVNLFRIYTLVKEEDTWTEKLVTSLGSRREANKETLTRIKKEKLHTPYYVREETVDIPIPD